MTWNGSSRAPQESLLPALGTDTKESQSTSPGSMKTSNLSSSSLASSSPKATPSSSWGLSVVSARRRATRSSKSGHTSTRSGTARSPRGGILKTQRHKLPRFIVVGFERSVSVGRAGAYNVSALLVVLIHPSAWKGNSRNFASGVYLGGLRSSGVSGFRCHQPHAFLASLTASINDSTASNIDRANAATQHLNRNCPTTRIRPSLATVPMCRRLLYVAPPSRREQPRPSF